MQSGSILSGIFHLALALMVVFGLPSFVKAPPEPEPLNTVEVVTLAPKATAPELTKPPVPKPVEPPKPEAKPPEPAPPAPSPPKAAEAKPEPKPEPIPDKKAEAVKPEKKEEPKKEEPKKVEAKKPEKDRFDSILDSVLKNKAPVKPAPPDPQAKPVQQAAAPQPRQTAPNLSAQLARGEMDAVRDKVRPCWNFPVGAPNPDQLVVVIQMQMNPDGTVREARILDGSRLASDPFYRAAAEAALRASRNPSCQPFPLPADKYNTWKTLEFSFDPRDL